MKVYMIWQGGINYATSDIADTEEFESLGDAVAEFARRARGGDAYYPCVEGSSGHIFYSDPRQATSGDVYPDRVIEVGPRGGIRVGVV